MKDRVTEKKKEIEKMFDSIAWHYDFINRLLSFGIDKYWRRKSVRTVLSGRKARLILDVATGTGDMAIEAAKYDPFRITGIDISAGMLTQAGKKVTKRGLSGMIELLQGESENLPFGDNTFDIVMSAFGVRNFGDLNAGVREMVRVTGTDGTVAILEFSKPEGKLVGKIFRFYFTNVLPMLGKLFSGHGAAYRYLPESVGVFPENKDFMVILKEAGLSEVKCTLFTGGIVALYTGEKKTHHAPV